MSLRELERKCEISNGVLGRISKSTSARTLKKLEEGSDLNVEWLMTGEGEMIRKNFEASRASVTEVRTAGRDYVEQGEIVHHGAEADAVMAERVRLLERLVAEKDERIAELKERIEELKGNG